MAHLLRGKQAGIQNDLSAGLNQDLFNIDDIARFGINSQTACLAYDPVQSLLALGTKSSQFGPGQIYVFGRDRIQCTFPLPSRGASAKELQFCADKLVSLDSKHDIAVYSLELKRLITSHSPPGVVTALCTDPMLDYAFLGMQTGDILAYDLDRENLAPFKIPMLWSEVDSRARVSPIISLQLHPRDVGAMLIGYTHGACIYSFKLEKPMRFFQYEVPRGAPGGDGDPAAANLIRRPKLTQAVWHPTGTFIMTGHEDSSLVFWDTVKDGRMLMARTLTDTNVATPGSISGTVGGGVSMAVKEPLFRMAWCANVDPEDTAILIAGGASTQAPTKGLTLFEMGRTPVYNTSSWDALSRYFEEPKRQRILPTPPGAEVVNFCLIPKTSPHFAGAHDPMAVIALLSSGELLTLTFPTGMPISPTNQLHPSLTLVHPFMRRISMAQTGREKWLGMQERRQQGPQITKGGSELPRSMRRFERRSILQVVHGDGTIRLFDPGHGDEVENEKLVQVDVGRAVGHWDNLNVTQTSLAGETGELAVGMSSGELIVFRWGTNRNAGREPQASRPNQPGALTNVADRVEPSLNEGLLPLTLLDQKDGPVTALKMSDTGFVAAGFEGGSIAIIDLRGPAIIFSGSVQEFNRKERRGSIRHRRNSSAADKPEWATKMEFSIMMLDGDDYSSILLHVGTNLGHLATFKIVPDSSGRYTANFAGSTKLDGMQVLGLFPINAETGHPASASQSAMAGLRTGLRISGALVAVTPTGIHIFRPASAKGAHKSFDSYFCDAAGLVHYPDAGWALLCLLGDGMARAYTLPGLRELAALNLSAQLDVRRFGDACIAPTGHIVAFTGPSELALLSVFGTGQPLPHSHDKLFNPDALIPPRPTISNVQWLTGTQYVTPADLDMLIGGPNRPPSKRMIQQARDDEAQMKAANRAGASSSSAAGTDEGYWAYMQRQIQERTEKLGMAEDSMSNLEQNSQSWLNDVNKFVGKQKRGAATGLLKARFGL